MPISILRYEIDGRFYDTDGVCDWVIQMLRGVHTDIIEADVHYKTNPQDGELAITVEVTRKSGSCRHRTHYPASIITPLEPPMPKDKDPLSAPDNDHLSDKPAGEEYDDSAPGPLDEDDDDDDDLTEFMDEDEEDDDVSED